MSTRLQENSPVKIVALPESPKVNNPKEPGMAEAAKIPASQCDQEMLKVSSSITEESSGEVSKCLKFVSKVYTDGSRFEGLVDSAGRRQGKGIFVNRHGDKYTGGWLDDRRHGFGTYEWNSGDCYTGSWLRGCMAGEGKFLWHNGDSYTGEWNNGKMHGVGTKTSANGDSYTGDWRNDKATGRGVKTFQNGDRHEGIYVDDRRHGPGTYYWSSGDKYTGNWEAGKMGGHGTKTMTNGDSYTGEWKNDKADGQGTKIFSSGDSHTGDYKNDCRHGFGVYRWLNGDRFEGTWVDGEQKGRGTYYYANQDVFKGKWLNGKKQGKGIFTCSASTTSYQEKWDNGVRVERVPCKYFPPRLLKTRRDEQEILPIAAVAQSPSEAARLKNEIDRLRSRLVAIQGPANQNQENQSNAGEETANLNQNTVTANPDEVAGQENIAPANNFMSPPSVTSASRCRPRSSRGRSGSLTEETTCKVCYDAAINTVLIRCGHMCCCLDCSSMLERCPLCRREIDEVIQTFKG